MEDPMYMHDDAQRDEATESGVHNIHVYVVGLLVIYAPLVHSN